MRAYGKPESFDGTDRNWRPFKPTLLDQRWSHRESHPPKSDSTGASGDGLCLRNKLNSALLSRSLTFLAPMDVEESTGSDSIHCTRSYLRRACLTSEG